MSDIKIQPSGSGTAVVTLTAPTTNTARTITFPDATGTLLNSGSTLDATKLSGNLPAISAANLTAIPAANITGTLPALAATNLTSIPAANITGTLPAISGANLTGLTSVQMPTGSVLQIVSTTKTDTWTYTASSTGFTDVTGLAATITPTSSSSKILVQVNINFSNNKRYSAAILLRGSTQIGGGTAEGSRPSVSVSPQANQDETHNQYVMRNSSFSFLDSPSTTSATTYKIQVGNTHEASSISYVNRPPSDDNAAYIHRGISTITLMEVAG
jgi:hypothetical protein